MHFKSQKVVVILLVSILLLVFITPISVAHNYDRIYGFQLQFGLLSKELYVSVPHSLYDHYSSRSHRIYRDSDYAKFVTPEAVSPIAESIRNITRNLPNSDEQFANAVLAVVRQIPYAISGTKYPVETIVNNSGDCGALSLLAASVMKAGGLDVVLLYFKEANHINVGVYLPYEPHGSWWWLPPTGYEVDGKKYWIAECTSVVEWTVGDVPPLLASEQPCIIPLETSEASSIACVSSRLGVPLNSSSISVNLSSVPSTISGQVRTLMVSGSIFPAHKNETVVVYISQDGISFNAFRTKTDQWGNYSLNWNLNSTGTYYIRTSWSGHQDCAYAGADSETLTVFIGFPPSLVQFEGPDYYYIYGRPYFVDHEFRVRQGVKDFLNVQLSGKGILLTGEFIVIRSEQTVGFEREALIMPISKRTITVPPSIPSGLVPIRVPDDFIRTVNDQFSFILQNCGGNNYSLSVRGLNENDVSQMKQIGVNKAAFMKAFENISEDAWYKVTARISEDEITADLHDVNGTLLESMAITLDEIDVSALVILIANNKDEIVAFKDLKVATLDDPTHPVEDDEKTASTSKLLVQYLDLAILMFAALAAVFYLKKRRQISKNGKDTLGKVLPTEFWYLRSALTAG